MYNTSVQYKRECLCFVNFVFVDFHKSDHISWPIYTKKWKLQTVPFKTQDTNLFPVSYTNSHSSITIINHSPTIDTEFLSAFLLDLFIALNFTVLHSTEKFPLISTAFAQLPSLKSFRNLDSLSTSLLWILSKLLCRFFLTHFSSSTLTSLQRPY